MIPFRCKSRILSTLAPNRGVDNHKEKPQ
jgi:hypothetical protein